MKVAIIGTAGVPANYGGIATYVISDYNGWLIPVSDTKKIVKCILQYKQLPSVMSYVSAHWCSLVGGRN